MPRRGELRVCLAIIGGENVVTQYFFLLLPLLSLLSREIKFTAVRSGTVAIFVPVA